MGKTRCIAPGCGKLTIKFRLPRNKRVRQEWLKRCRAPENLSNQAKICPMHFNVACIRENDRLYNYSVPSLFVDYVQTGKEVDYFMCPVDQTPSIENPKIIKVEEILQSTTRGTELIGSIPNTKVLCPTKTYSRKRQLNLNLGHKTSQQLTANTPKKLKNDMENYTEPRFDRQKIIKLSLDDLVGTYTTSKDQMRQPKMSKSCKPLEVKIKEEKLNEIYPCAVCFDVFSTSEDLDLHVNCKHMKIEINEELITEKIKQENDVEDDIHKNDKRFQIVIKNELIIDKIKNEKLPQIEDDIS